jgi:hypothetical protein
VVPLFDDLAVLENKNPVIVTSEYVKEVGETVTYRSALAIVWIKSGK